MPGKKGRFPLGEGGGKKKKPSLALQKEQFREKFEAFNKELQSVWGRAGDERKFMAEVRAMHPEFSRTEWEGILRDIEEGKKAHARQLEDVAEKSGLKPTEGQMRRSAEQWRVRIIAGVIFYAKLRKGT